MLTFIHYSAQVIGTGFIVWLVIRAWSRRWDKGRTTTRTGIIFTIAGACLIGGMFVASRTWAILLWAFGFALVIWIWFEAFMVKRLVRKHLGGHPYKVGKLTNWLFRDFFERDQR